MGVGKGGGAWYSQRGSLGYRRLTWGSTQGAGALPARTSSRLAPAGGQDVSWGRWSR